MQPNYFAILPATVRYAKIADRAKILFAEITALSGKQGYCFASNAWLAEQYECTPQAISKHLATLSDSGFVRIEIDKGAGNSRRIYPLIDIYSNGATINQEFTPYQPTVDSYQLAVDTPINPRLIPYQPTVETYNSITNNTRLIENRIEGEAPKETMQATKSFQKDNPSPAAGRFQKPTADEITGYLEDLYIEPQWQPRFRALPGTTAEEIHDYYEANGWKVGRNPMKDWRAACRNWLKNNEKFNRSNTNSNAKPTSTTKKPLVSEETHRRVYAELLHELGVTGGPAQ
jgi:biotin operon repressor